MIVLLVVAILAAAYVLSTVCRSGHKGWKDLAGWSYAHRGVHGNGVPENSMKAFRKAKDSGYGIELDVHLLADGSLAVIHDFTLTQVAGADVTVEDLKKGDLDSYYLNGTLETIPAFDRVLQLVDGKVPLIVELKVYRNNYAELCRKACDLLDAYNGPYCIESFDPRCVRWLRKNRPDIIRGQLAENYFKSKNCLLSWYMKLLLSYHMLSFLTLPDFVAHRFSDRKNLSTFLCCKLWKSKGVTWTIKSKREFGTAVKENWIPIFEGFEP